jgi:multiple sugar transport system substrate-binding protein
VSLRGITWSHPRGWAPLEAASGAPGAPDVPVRWDRQPLSGFESRSIAELAAQYDLLVLDHPGLGAAVESDALLPLDEVIGQQELASWRDCFIGAAAGSYALGGRQWAVPIDAATQVGAYRADLAAEIPRSWPGVIELMKGCAACVPTKPPHALLTFLGIVAAIEPGFTPTPEALVPAAGGELALGLLGDLLAASAPGTLDLDPIGVLDRMADGLLDYSPLLYGYVTYSHRTMPSSRLLFADAPSWTAGSPPGSILGGTGLAISRRCASPEAALAWLRHISGAAVQSSAVPRAGGQPARQEAWTSAAVNADAGYFYARTLRSQLTASRRPRFAGWIDVQRHGSALLLDGLLAGRPPAGVLAGLNDLYRDAHPEI